MTRKFRRPAVWLLALSLTLAGCATVPHDEGAVARVAAAASVLPDRALQDRLLTLDPEHVGAMYFEGVLLAEQHRYREAIERWHKVIDLEPAGEFARRARRDARTAADLQSIFTPGGAA
jgi:tetratricopeptide (TPR) repeat protein